ncbi:hypothetical protein ANN_13925 [Periplaneta americana]|uniref:Reverse transcriptase n=1 Tax=Periplaneta americana TaxID=6978 RepID=A0ABQ8SW82_PERAM|nr:hypothetical protein ANN_13925 [Periplaneta americana]
MKLICSTFKDHLQIYTDGSIKPDDGTSEAGYYIPKYQESYFIPCSSSSSLDTELLAIDAALQYPTMDMELEDEDVDVEVEFRTLFSTSSLHYTLHRELRTVWGQLYRNPYVFTGRHNFKTTRFRHPGCNETETLGHVLGFCRKTELLRNNRHHKARTGIADVLKRRGWEVYEEIHCVSSLDSNRRANIVTIHRTQSKGIVLDPTIRFERDALQAQHVDEEKKSIYESCIPYLSEKYNIPTSQWSVSGLLFGARCETWTLTLREEHRLRVFENKVLRKIFGVKRDEVTGEWRKLHNTELHALYSSPDIIRNIESRRLSTTITILVDIITLNDDDDDDDEDEDEDEDNDDDIR